MYTVTYLEHSGFFLELEKVCLLFDYWKGNLPEPVSRKPLLVFASHGHRDHYVREIFDYGRRWEQAAYLLGNDITLSAKRREEWNIREAEIHRLAPDCSLTLYGVTVRTQRSTDAGVAFLVEAEGKTFYHAGDLNWWRWDGSTPDEDQAMADAFRTEVEKLRQIPINLAFLTLDGRQEQHRFLGIDYYLRQCTIAKAVPMHSFGRYKHHYDLLESELSTPYRDRLLLMTEPGMQIQMDD